MDLISYVRTLRRWLWLLALCPLVAGLSAGVVAKFLPPVYDANVSILVKPAQPLTTADSGVSALSADQISRTYADLLTKGPLLQQVIDDLGLHTTPDLLAQQIKATPDTNTTILVVTVESTHPALARDIANRLVDDFIAETNSFQAKEATLYTGQLNQQILSLQQEMTQEQQAIDSIRAQQSTGQPISLDQQSQLTLLSEELSANQGQYSTLLTSLADIEAQMARSTDNLVVVARADLPTRATSPRLVVDMILAAIGGFGLALAVAFACEHLDQSVKSDEDLTSRAGVVPIAHIPHAAPVSGRRRGELVTMDGAELTGEPYRQLRTNILFAAVDRPIKTLVVTSSIPGEGKSRTASNLAVVLAEAGHPTVLVDADFRRPSMRRIFGKVRSVGLSNLILQDVPESELIVPVEGVPHLWLVASGALPPNPSELLGSKRMKGILEMFKQRYAYVVIDTPPVGAVTDGLVLAAAADAAIIVVEHRRTSIADVAHTNESLQRVGANVLGAVVNKVRGSSGSYYYYYSYRAHYASSTTEPEPAEVEASKVS